MGTNNLKPCDINMVKYYEKTKSNYAKDIDHLPTFNKNGLWIKENTKDGVRIVSVKMPNKYYRNFNFFFDENYNLKK